MYKIYFLKKQKIKLIQSRILDILFRRKQGVFQICNTRLNNISLKLYTIQRTARIWLAGAIAEYWAM